MPIPEVTRIVSSRVALRPVAPSDLSDLFEINGDAEVTAYLPYPTWTGAEDGRAWLARMAALADTGSGRQLVIERNTDSKVIGTALLFKFDEASSRVELGYVLGRPHWKKGLMREALGALCTHAFGPLRIRRIEAEVQPSNAPSNTLLASLGFTLEGTLRKRWVAKGAAYDTNIYGCLAEEWRPPADAV